MTTASQRQLSTGRNDSSKNGSMSKDVRETNKEDENNGEWGSDSPTYQTRNSDISTLDLNDENDAMTESHSQFSSKRCFGSPARVEAAAYPHEEDEGLGEYDHNEEENDSQARPPMQSLQIPSVAGLHHPTMLEQGLQQSMYAESTPETFFGPVASISTYYPMDSISSTSPTDNAHRSAIEADQTQIKKLFKTNSWNTAKPLKRMGARTRSVDLFAVDKLYGRAKEHSSLVEAYRRITRCPSPRPLHFVLISGQSGTGKTRLAESLRQTVRSDRGFLCSAKFDQLNRIGVDPLVPFLTIFADFVLQVLEKENRATGSIADEVRDAILTSVDSNILATLTNMIPSLVDLLGSRKKRASYLELRREISRKRIDAATAPRADAANYSIFALQHLLRAIASPERPLIMLLDDLQWANQGFLQRLRTLLLDTKLHGILFLGTCRNDVEPTSDLSTSLRQLETDDNITITNIGLSNLPLTDVHLMVTDMFRLPMDASNFLSQLLYKHSDGNFFYLIEMLRVLQYDRKVLNFDPSIQRWKLTSTDLSNYYFCFSSSERDDGDLGEFIDQKLSALPQNVQKVLMVAACLGSRIEEDLLYHALQEPVATALVEMVEQGVLVFDETRERYQFKHDKIQAASYGLIEEGLRPAFHLEVGRRLWRHLGSSGDMNLLDKYLFVVLSQIKQGSSLLMDQQERYEVIELCIRVAEQYAMSSAFQTALEYLTFALSLLGDDHWEEAYELSLVLYNHSAEMEFCVGDNTRVDVLLNEALEHTIEFPDKIRAYSTQVYVMGVRGHMERAIETGVEVLDRLGVHLRCHYHKSRLFLAMRRIRNHLNTKSKERILRLPHMDDPNKLAAMQMLNMLFLNSFLTKPKMFPFVVLKMMKLTLMHGLSAISAVAFAGYGALVCMSGRVQEGMLYGQISLEILKDFEAKSFLPRCHAFVYGFIRPYAKPWTESFEPLKVGHRVGLQTGDCEFALVNAAFYAMFMLDCGKESLPKVARRVAELKEMTEMHGQADQFGVFKPILALFRLLMGPDTNLFDHSDGLDDGLLEAINKRNTFAVKAIIFAKSSLVFLAGDFKLALEIADSQLFSEQIPSIQHTISIWFDGLNSFARARQLGGRNEQDLKYSRRSLIQRGRSRLKIVEQFAKTCPYHCLAKKTLLEAEYAAVQGNHHKSSEKYRQAMVLCDEYGGDFECAIANHVAGRHYTTDLKDVAGGVEHYLVAIRGYNTCGALSLSKVLFQESMGLLERHVDIDNKKRERLMQQLQESEPNSHN